MASTIFLSFPIGPLVGGSLLDHFWWGSVFLINVPVVAAALIAVAFLMPESRSAQRPGIDVAGRPHLQRRAGRADLQRPGRPGGLEQHGRDRGHRGRCRGAGRVRRVGTPADPAYGRDRRGHGLAGCGVQPLIELALFRSAGFTWGTILATLVSFAMFGIMFAMPQYFQEVRAGPTPSAAGCGCCR